MMFAYINPGTGSLVIQVAMLGLASGWLMFRPFLRWIRRVKRWLLPIGLSIIFLLVLFQATFDDSPLTLVIC